MKKTLPPLFVWMTGSFALLAQPLITQPPANQVVTNGGTAVFSVAVSGPGPFTYQWQFNGTNCDLITTVAGTGTAGFAGDSGAATNAVMNYPQGVAADGAGNFFIAEYSNSRVRKVNTNGVITTLAGNGAFDSYGDGGPATNAALFMPSGVAVDGAGNVYIADRGNQRIRRVDANGIITTVAGGGPAFSSDGGPATNALLNYPSGVAVDNAGNLFIADSSYYRIRRVDTNGIITTVAGNGSYGDTGDGGPATSAALANPLGVAVDNAGNVFIADSANGRIRKVNANGIITAVAGGGSVPGDGAAATNAFLNNPSGVAVDTAGNVFIADSVHYRIRKVDTNGIISSVAGNGTHGYSGDGGPAMIAMLSYLNGLTLDVAGNVLVADSNNQRIRKVSLPGLTDQTTSSLTLVNLNTNLIGNYSVIISSAGGSVTSSVATLNLPAFLISPPQSFSILAGGSGTFSVTAGSTGPLGYQWSCNGTNLDGATNSVLSLTNIQPSQAGPYSVVVSNPFGTATNSSAILTVVPLAIASQPQNQSVGVGATVAFSVTASLVGPFSYQWQLQNTNLPGATNSTLVLTNVQRSQSGSYSVIVSNPFGSVTSSNANLTVVGVLVWGNFNYGNLAVSNVPMNVTNVVVIAAGDTHALALRADGSVVAWGGNSAGQTNVPPNLSNVVSIAAGSTHSLALLNDGTLAIWGRILSSSTRTVPPSATNIVGLALGPGAQHALALRSDGTVLDWGSNDYGLTNIPATARGVVAVASGATYGLALRSDGKPVTWGSGQFGSPPSIIPAAATNIVAIAAGWYGNAALRADGTVLVWGSISTPVSGFTNVIDLACPMAFTGTSDILALRRNGTLAEYSTGLPKYPTNNITAIAAGSYNAFAVVGSGPPVFPGLPSNRTVASGSRAYFRAVAVGAMPISYQWNCNGTNVPGATNSVLVLTNVQPIQAGSYFTLTASNAFGLATNGAMMLKETASEAYVQASTLSAVINQKVTFTATTIGQGPFAYQWQLNGTNLLSATNLVLTLTNAQLSDAGNYAFLVNNSFGTVTNNFSLSVTPTLITNLPQNLITFVGGNAAFGVGLQAIIPVSYQWQFNGANLDGATNSLLTLTNVPYAVGGTYSVIINDAFETITNSATLAIVPVAAWGYINQSSLPPALTNVIAIANGTYHELALGADGTVVGWGNNIPGGSTVPPGLSNVIAITAGNRNSLALINDGSVFAWGSQTNLPNGLTNVVAVAAGYSHDLALKSDGSVVAWGDNSYGQTNMPANLTNVVMIAASIYSSMAIKADGTVAVWGAVSNAPPNATNAVQIATGGSDDLVLQAGGLIVGWGSNSSGQDNMPAGLSNVVGIATGYSQSAALKADGTVFAWGANQYGQSTVPTGLKNVISIKGNGYQNLALIGDGPPTMQVAISNSVWSASGFRISVPSQSGRVYALEYKDSLADTNWSALPLVAGTGRILALTDPAATHSQRFYRVRRW